MAIHLVCPLPVLSERVVELFWNVAVLRPIADAQLMTFNAIGVISANQRRVDGSVSDVVTVEHHVVAIGLLKHVGTAESSPWLQDDFEDFKLTVTFR